MGQNKEDEMNPPNDAPNTPEAIQASQLPATTTPAAENKVEEKVPALIAVRNEVKQVLKTTGGDAVKAALHAKMVADGIAKRSEATAKVIGKVEEFEKTLAGIKPKHLGVTLQGKPSGDPVYTPEDAKLFKETSEKLAKAHAALDAAFSTHDFTKVFELAQKG